MKACKNCHSLSDGDICPKCGERNSKHWYGFLIVIDAKNSVIAEKIGFNEPGRYALKVR